MQSPHQRSLEHSNLQPDCQKTPKIVCVKRLLNATLKPIKGAQNVHFEPGVHSKNCQTTCQELVNKDGSYFLVSSESPQQRAPLRVSCPSTSKVIQLPPAIVRNETSHSIQKTASVKKPLQEARMKAVGFQVCSQMTSPPNGHHPHVQLQNGHEMTKRNERLQEQTKTNIENVHHEEIVVAAKRTRRSAKKNTSTLRVRLFRAKLKIKKLEAALEKVKKHKARHKEEKKRALKEFSWASLSDKRKLHGRRYSEKHKRFAIGLYKQSRKAYQFCRKELSLPSVRSLQEWMKKDKLKNQKSKNVSSDSVRACVTTGNSTEAERCTAEEETPRITGLISVQETTEAVSPGQDIEVLVQTSERGGVVLDPCNMANMTGAVICKTQLNGREATSLTQEEAVKVVEAFYVSARDDL